MPVPSVVVDLWVAVQSEGWWAASMESAEDAVDQLVREHGHGTGVRCVHLRSTVEVPRPQRVLGLVPVAPVEGPLPLLIESKA